MTYGYWGSSPYEEQEILRQRSMNQMALAQINSNPMSGLVMAARGQSSPNLTPSPFKAKPKTIREELQNETDEWLKGV